MKIINFTDKNNIVETFQYKNQKIEVKTEAQHVQINISDNNIDIFNEVVREVLSIKDVLYTDIIIKSENCYWQYIKNMNNINFIYNKEWETIKEIMDIIIPYFDVNVNKINIFMNLDRDISSIVGINNKQIELFKVNNENIAIEYKNFKGVIQDRNEYEEYYDNAFNIKNKKNEHNHLISIYEEKIVTFNKEIDDMFNRIKKGIKHILMNNLSKDISEYTYEAFKILAMEQIITTEIPFDKITEFHSKNLLKEEVLIATFKNIANAPFEIEEITVTPKSFAVKMNETDITSEKIWNIFNTLKSLVSGEHINIKLNDETSITRMDGEIIICKKEITEEDIKKALWYSDERWGIPVIINDKVEIFESNVKIIGKITKKLEKIINKINEEN